MTQQTVGAHTPGPWVAKQVSGFGANTFIYSESPDGHPYNGWTYIAQDVSGHANARLIAAAPAQHAALKDLVEYVRWCVDRELLAGRWLDDPIVSAAEAAIALATPDKDGT